MIISFLSTSRTGEQQIDRGKKKKPAGAMAL
jgi:hypothetical protein